MPNSVPIFNSSINPSENIPNWGWHIKHTVYNLEYKKIKNENVGLQIYIYIHIRVYRHKYTMYGFMYVFMYIEYKRIP